MNVLCLISLSIAHNASDVLEWDISADFAEPLAGFVATTIFRIRPVVAAPA